MKNNNMGGRLMMKLLVGTESMFFLTLIMAYVYFSAHAGFKPEQSGQLHIKTTAVFSVFLFASSFTFWRAEANARQGKQRRIGFWLLVTLGLGLVFLFGQAHEYAQLLNDQVTMSSSIFGSSFFTLTGFHGLHVFVGLVLIAILVLPVFFNKQATVRSGVLSVVGIYWHFVDIVWLVVFMVVYVAPHLNIAK